MALFPVSQLNQNFVSTNKLIYGFPGTGKSTLASLMTDGTKVPLFVATEEGHGSLNVSKIRITSGFDGLIKLCDFLEAPGQKDRIANEHSCIVIDLITDIDAWCATYVAKMKNVEYVGDMDQGKGWKLLRDKFQEPLIRLMNLAPVTFIAHAQDKRVTWNGEQIVIQAPSLSKAGLEFVNGKVDVIMYMVPANSKREFPAISMRPCSAWIAKSRQKALCQDFPVDPTNPLATYQKIKALYAQAQAQAQDANNQAADAGSQGGSHE